MKQNRFIIISPFYNAKKTMEQFLASIHYQTYKNFRIILLDDMSTDGSFDVVKGFCKKNNIPYEWSQDEKNIDSFESLKLSLDVPTARIVYIKNQNKLWEVANILNALKLCKDDDIILRIDPDDFLMNLCSLEDLNDCYNQNDVEAVWTAHRWEGSKRNISGPMTADADVYKHPWVSSHLKSFRKYLINDVKDENFRSWNGEYFKRIGDQAIYLPVLHKTKKRGFLPIQTYFYHIEDNPATYQTEDSKFQREEAEYLRSRGFIS